MPNVFTSGDVFAAASHSVSCFFTAFPFGSGFAVPTGKVCSNRKNSSAQWDFLPYS